MSAGLRSGQLACACEPGARAASDERPGGGLAALAAGFGLAVLAQVLLTALLPLAAIQLTTDTALRTVPFAAMLAGIALATWPASLLVDGLGRRGGLAIGASLGVAGGLLLVLAVETQRFGLLVLAAFWLGIAQGFGLFQRHLAVGGGGLSRVAIVVAAGALGGLLGPTLLMQAEALTQPFTFRGAAFAVVAVAVAGLIATALQPTRGVFASRGGVEGEVLPEADARRFMGATVFGALAWGMMAAAMAGAPLALIGCGLSMGETTTLVSWHAIAMYAPAAALPFLRGVKPASIAGAGVALTMAAVAGWAVLGGAEGAGAALVAAGIGWSFALSGATAWLGEARPTRGMLALHDAALLAAAVLGALLAGRLV